MGYPKKVIENTSEMHGKHSGNTKHTGKVQRKYRRYRG